MHIVYNITPSLIRYLQIIRTLVSLITAMHHIAKYRKSMISDYNHTIYVTNKTNSVALIQYNKQTFTVAEIYNGVLPVNTLALSARRTWHPSSLVHSGCKDVLHSIFTLNMYLGQTLEFCRLSDVEMRTRHNHQLLTPLLLHSGCKYILAAILPSTWYNPVALWL